MKKLILTAAVACGAIFSYAQTESKRVAIYKQGYYTPQCMLAERIDSIVFMKAESNVSVTLEVGDYVYDEESETGTLYMSATRSENCTAFQCTIVDAEQFDAYTEGEQAGLLEQNGGELYYEDFGEGSAFNNIDVPDGKDYYVVALAYDNWGTPCSVTKAKFTVPKIPLVGEPKVDVTFSDITYKSFKATITPNKDASSFGYLYAWKGQLLLQSEMMGGIENYLNSFIAASSKTEVSLTGDANYYEPGTEWEIGVLPKDVNNRYDGVQWFYTKTAYYGDGVTTPSVEITTPKYYMSKWTNEVGLPVYKPTLRVEITPNKGSNCYRFATWYKADYEKDPEGCIASLATDMDPNSWATSYYYNIEPSYDEYAIDPNTEIVIVAVPKATDGTWGEPVVLNYTTPEKADPAEESAKVDVRSNAVSGISAPVNKGVKSLSLTKMLSANNGRAATLPFAIRPVQKAQNGASRTLKVIDLNK